MGRKIDQHTATNGASAFHVVPEEVTFCWIHEVEDVERTKSNKFRKYKAYVLVTESLPQMSYVPGQL